MPLALHGDEAPVTGAWGHKLSYHSVVFLIASCLEVCVGSYIWVCVCVCASSHRSWQKLGARRSLFSMDELACLEVVTQVVMLPMLSDVLHPEGHFVFLFALTPDIHNEGGSHRA